MNACAHHPTNCTVGLCRLNARCMEARSEGACLEMTGPAPVVGSGGVVVCGPSSAELMKLVTEWLSHADKQTQLRQFAQDSEKDRRLSTEAHAYEMCALQLRRIVESVSQRQPTDIGDDRHRRREAP
jgi:hypothetical protein